MTRALARAVSIFGHPVLVLPLAVLTLALVRGERAQAAWMLAAFAAFAAVVMGYSWRQVRRGRWTHVDASDVRERGNLNRFLLALLGIGAVVAVWLDAPQEFSLGLILSTAMVLLAVLAARWLKLSLHMAFAVFAAALLWLAGGWALAAGLAFAALVAWSRLQLQRHAPRDLVAGAAAGALAGCVFHLLTPGMAG
jgi:membrane-associated phospholipid phosphatase